VVRGVVENPRSVRTCFSTFKRSHVPTCKRFRVQTFPRIHPPTAPCQPLIANRQPLTAKRANVPTACPERSEGCKPFHLLFANYQMLIFNLQGALKFSESQVVVLGSTTIDKLRDHLKLQQEQRSFAGASLAGKPLDLPFDSWYANGNA
jgi:hypothetical protein